MNKALIILSTTAILGLTACMNNTSSPKDLPAGTYETETETNDRDGTDTKSKTTTKVGYDKDGNKTAVVKTKKTTDPEGLMNKKTTESTTVVK